MVSLGGRIGNPNVQDVIDGVAFCQCPNIIGRAVAKAPFVTDGLISACIDLQVGTYRIGDLERPCKFGMTHDQVAVRQECLAPVAPWLTNRQKILDHDVFPVPVP